MDYNRIEILRKKLKLTKKELYNKLDMSNQGYCDMINDQTMKVKTLEKISEILNVSPRYFFDDIEYKKNLIEEDPEKYILKDQIKKKDEQINKLIELLTVKLKNE